MENYKDNILTGILIGLSVPIVGAALTMILFEELVKLGVMKSYLGDFTITQERTIYVIGILFNLIPFQYFKYKKYFQSLNGVVSMTILVIIIWVIYYHKSLFV